MTSSGPTSAPPAPPLPPPRRRGRMATLPKMNNSERGKYYRRKYKNHEIHLEESIDALHKQVRDLQLFLDVRAALAHANPYEGACDGVVPRIFEYFARARVGMRYDASFHTAAAAPPPPSPPSPPPAPRVRKWSVATGSPPPAASAPPPPHGGVYPWHEHHTFLFFDLVSFTIEGNREAPVVVMRGMLHTQYSRQTIENLFPHVLHHPFVLDQLLDKRVQYPCTYHFYCGTDGQLHDKIVEADYVHGLQQVLGRLEDVMWLLDGSHRLKKRQDSIVETLRGPSSTMALEYILT